MCISSGLITPLLEKENYFNSVLLLHILKVNTTYVSTPQNPNAVF
jgi:hypothetical protein